VLDYSPYHHVTSGVAYPSTLLIAGENDRRVSAWHSRKMAARLRAATAGRGPILFSSNDAGHVGSSLSAEIEEMTDVHVLLFRALGLAHPF
jgi:prolyl oligopeptidase